MPEPNLGNNKTIFIVRMQKSASMVLEALFRQVASSVSWHYLTVCCIGTLRQSFQCQE